MNAEDIKTLLAIAETHSFSAAAELLFVSQSTISHRLQRLENELQTTLVYRSKGKRYVSLTPKGSDFIPLAQQWLALDKSTKNFIQNERTSSLRIGQVDWFYMYPFARFYQSLTEKHPELKLDIHLEHSWTIIEAIVKGELDIGFVMYPNSFDNIISKPVFRDPLVLVCSSARKFPTKKVNPEWLPAEHEVAWNYYANSQIWHEQWWNPSIVPSVQIDFLPSMSFSFLTDENHWLVSPKSIAQRVCAKHPELAIHDFSVPPPDPICYFVYSKQASSQASALIRLAEQHIEKQKNLFLPYPYMSI